MSRYLEEAAELLRKAVEANERAANRHSERLLNENRQKYAKTFAELAAIDKGLLPDRLVRKYLEGGEVA